MNGRERIRIRRQLLHGRLVVPNTRFSSFNLIVADILEDEVIILILIGRRRECWATVVLHFRLVKYCNFLLFNSVEVHDAVVYDLA